MPPSSLDQSLATNDAFYPRAMAPLHPPALQRWLDIKRLMDNLYQQLRATEARIAAMEADLGYKYSPTQPRDDHGRWWSGGGGGSVGGNITNDVGVSNADHLGYSTGASVVDPNTGTPYPAPPGLNIPANIEKAKTATAADMYRWFHHGGAMDYQRTTGEFNGAYRNVTNYNFGIVAAAAGYPLSHTLALAGSYNILVGHTTPTDTHYGIRQDAVNNITHGWNDYHQIWSKAR